MQIKQLEVLVMDNGEILCKGKTLGFVSEFEPYLNKPQSINIPLTDQDCEEFIAIDGHSCDWTYPTQDGQDIKVHIYKDNSNE